MQNHYDILIIGGGINGAGIARDAAGRGAKIMLVEKDDLANHTSSASTKLIHGGLRYLEHYEFRLVRESLIERERLLAMAPHIIWPMRFVLPHDAGLRPKWMLRLGLFLYDYIGGRKLLPPTRSVKLRDAPHGNVLQERLTKGFEYSDCWVEDARLVVLNCMDAKERGADIRTRTECTRLERSADHWTATLKTDQGEEQITARMVVNAAGPWVDSVLNRANPNEAHNNLRLVKGSHLIFDRLFDGDHCYIFQNGDGRIIFAIPYEGRFTLVGTTDQSFTGDAGGIDISDEEARYLCDALNEYLQVRVSPEQAVASYAGVRPLYDDSSKDNSTVTRDYVFEVDAPDGAPPILSVFGGKVTTYRKLAEHALAKLSKLGGLSGEAWTAGATLPGGDLGEGLQAFNAFAETQIAAHPEVEPATLYRLARAYGTRIEQILAGSREEIAPGVIEGELEYLVRHEFARNAEDVLKRRSKLYLHLTLEEQAKVADWFSTSA